MKVDAHQHFWRLADRAGGWPPPQLEAIHRDFGPTDLAPLLQATGVEATVLVQSLPTVADTHWMLSVARATPWVRGVVGWVDFKSADAPAQVAALAQEPLLKGLRPMLQDLADDHWIADEATAPAAAAMARHGLSFDALVLPRQLPALWVFARRHPGLAIIIDHGAKPPIAAGGFEPWHSDMARLAALPNVCCKLSGLLTEAGTRADAAGLLPWVQALWRMFGPGRLLWGSDWPVLRLAAGYEAWHAMADGLVSSLDPGASTAERAALFGDNATRLYRL